MTDATAFWFELSEHGGLKPFKKRPDDYPNRIVVQVMGSGLVTHRTENMGSWVELSVYDSQKSFLWVPTNVDTLAEDAILALPEAIRVGADGVKPVTNVRFLTSKGPPALITNQTIDDLIAADLLERTGPDKRDVILYQLNISADPVSLEPVLDPQPEVANAPDTFPFNFSHASPYVVKRADIGV